MRTILKESFLVIKRVWEVHLLMYLVSLLLSAVPVFLFYGILEKESAHLLTLNELVGGFDFMIFGDFMHQSGEAFKPIIWYGLLAGFLGSLVYTFFSGGVIDRIANSKEKFSFSRFFKESIKLFPKYLGLLCLTGLLLFVFFLISGLFYFIFVVIADGSTERGYFFWLLPPTFLLATFMSFGLVVSFYAKVFIYKEPHLGFVNAFWESFYYVFKHKIVVWYFWITVILGLCLLMLYLFLDKYIGMTSAFTIGLMLVSQQLLVLSKFVIKHWNYALALDYFGQHSVELSPLKTTDTFLSSEEMYDSSKSKLSEQDEGS